MQSPGRFTHPATRRSRQRGQAYTEYIVVTVVVIGFMLLATSDHHVPISSLKSFFSAYSFTLSLP